MLIGFFEFHKSFRNIYLQVSINFNNLFLCTVHNYANSVMKKELGKS